MPCWCILTTFGTVYILVTGCWIFSFCQHSDSVKQVKFAVSMHFLENAWEEWAEICHDVTWPPSEQIWFWSRWGVTAITSPNLLVHLCVISREMKKAYSSICLGGGGGGRLRCPLFQNGCWTFHALTVSLCLDAEILVMIWQGCQRSGKSHGIFFFQCQGKVREFCEKSGKIFRYG